MRRLEAHHRVLFAASALHGSSDKLVIFFEGGGVCFNSATCRFNDGFSSFRIAIAARPSLTRSRSAYTRGA